MANNDVGIYQGVRLPKEHSSDDFFLLKIIGRGLWSETILWQLLKTLRGRISTFPWRYKCLKEP